MHVRVCVKFSAHIYFSWCTLTLLIAKSWTFIFSNLLAVQMLYFQWIIPFLEAQWPLQVNGNFGLPVPLFEYNFFVLVSLRLTIFLFIPPINFLPTFLTFLLLYMFLIGFILLPFSLCLSSSYISFGSFLPIFRIFHVYSFLSSYFLWYLHLLAQNHALRYTSAVRKHLSFIRAARRVWLLVHLSICPQLVLHNKDC